MKRTAITYNHSAMQAQQESTAALLGAEIDTSALTKLTGGAITGHPHDLVMPANGSSAYDADDDDVFDVLPLAAQP